MTISKEERDYLFELIGSYSFKEIKEKMKSCGVNNSERYFKISQELYRKIALEKQSEN